MRQGLLKQRSLTARVRRFDKWKPFLPPEVVTGKSVTSASANRFDNEGLHHPKPDSSTKPKPNYIPTSLCEAPAPTPAQSPVHSSVLQCMPLTFLLCNVRCLLGKLGELSVLAARVDAHIVFLNETWLDSSTEHVSLPGYCVLSRRDRSNEPNRGGIAAFVRNDVSNAVFVSHSNVAERSWHIIHRDSGGIAVANWYRPPQCPDNSITSLRDEMNEMSPMAESFVVLGDMNIHHRSRLRHSSGDSREGRILRDLAEESGLRQLVEKPTRGPYCLDLVLSDLARVSCQVGPSISDHATVCVKPPDPNEAHAPLPPGGVGIHAG